MVMNSPLYPLIIFAKLLAICLLHLFTSILPYIMQYSIVHGQTHVTLGSTYLLNNENCNSVC